MRRLLGDTIAARLLFLVCVCIALSIGLTWFTLRVGAVRPDYELRHQADRVLGVAAALEAAPAALRPAMAAHASTHDTALRWVAQPPSETVTHAQDGFRALLVRASRWPEARFRAVSDAAVAVLLEDGSALVATQAAHGLEEPAPRLLPLGLLVVSALFVCALAARPVAHSVARFADAAEAFGREASTRPLPARGPREVRAAIAAFNAMQGRIERVMAERTAMLAALSHDLRTPLARMRLRAEFLADAREQARMLRDLDEMTAMVDQSLQFLRDDSRSEPDTPLDIAVLLQGIAEEQADLGHAVGFHGPEHATLRARPLSLKRAFGNIVENAVKYGSRAEIELTLNAGGATVSISDDGPGIPEALRERVFEPFFRAEASRNRETGGVGLGLSIARAVVRAHGGEIRLDDHAMGGLVVRVALPAGV